MTRRQLLGAVGAGWLADHWLPAAARIDGRVIGADHRLGHRLREATLPEPPGPPEQADVVVLGAGASGAAAAWRLRGTGLEVRLLELEPFPGGTSAWGRSGAVPHPWGAHYLPVPNPGARATARLLEELGVIVGWDAAGRPRFDEAMLCHAPEERLFYRGVWHPGLVPDDALGPAERAEMDRFHAIEQALTAARGSDGRHAFELPFELSSRDPRFVALDRMSMAEWLEREGLTGPFVRWYARYATLDDFGAELGETSAWAGLHYFTARKLRSEQLTASRFLVWPEGNGWLLERMLSRIDGRVELGVLATSVRPTGRRRVEVRALARAGRAPRRIEARAVIVALPAHVAHRVLSPALRERNQSWLRRRSSAPWLVANLHLRRPVEPDLPWDNVIHGAAGLGYVHAGHQLTARRERTVWTYYRAFGMADAAAARSSLERADWSELASAVLADLAPAHPELPGQAERIDVMIWGHGMPRPTPGFLGADPFSTRCALDRLVAWAHVDQTGFALFEEAVQRGVRAAETIADALGVSRGESWL